MEKRKQPSLEGALIVGTRAAAMPSKGKPGVAGDGKAEQALNVLQDLLEHMELEADLDIRDDGEEIVIDIEGKDSGRVIGKKGQTLDSLQFIVNKIVNRDLDGRRHVLLDSGDYRERREESLVSMAERQAERAVKKGEVVSLRPMSPRDRRVVHLSLAKFPGVITESSGRGAGRRIQIIPGYEDES